MANFLEKQPRIERRGGVVHVIDEYGDRAMLLGDFVAYAAYANRLARQWVAEVAKPARIGRLKKVKGR